MPVSFSWVELHGALTHFPIVFLLSSVACDCAALLPWPTSRWPRVGAQLRHMGLVSLAGAVVTSAPALLTGYLTGRGLSHPPLGFTLHWEAAVATSTIATLLLFWRLITRNKTTGPRHLAGLLAALTGAMAVSLTGYLGGQMVLGGGPAPVSLPASSPLPAIAGSANGQTTLATANAVGFAAANLNLAAERLGIATDKLAFTLQTGSAKTASPAPPPTTARAAATGLVRSGGGEDLAAVNQKLAKITTQLVAIADRLPGALVGRNAVPAAVGPPAPTVPLAPTTTREKKVHPNKTGQASAAAPVSTTAAAQPDDAGLVDQGAKLFRSDDQGCISCHRLGDEGGAIGPDLTHEAARGHDATWQSAHLKDPGSRVPASRMPPYNTLQAHDLRAIVAYLGSLK